MASPVPTHYSRVSGSVSPQALTPQSQVMLAQQDALRSTAEAQQDNYGLLLRQLTEIQLSHDTLQRITSAADDMQELQNAMGSMIQRHTVHEQLFFATDDHIRQLYGKHVALMDMLQQFEQQQSQRWHDHVKQYDSQQASLQAVMDKLSQATAGMDESGLTSLRRELDLLHEPVGSLQADNAAMDTKLHECLVRLSALSAIPGSGEGSSVAGAPSHPQVAERIRDELQGHARQAEFFMKQLLEERRAREALELRLNQETEQRKLLESRIALLERSRYHTSAQARETPTEFVPMSFSLSPTVTRESDQKDESDPEQQWWFQSEGPPGLRAPPPPLPEELRKQTVENPTNLMRPVFGTALGVDLSQQCNAAASQSIAQELQTGDLVAEKGCELPVAGNTGALNKDEGRSIPEGRWKMLRDIPQLNLAVGQAWEAGIYVQSWHTQCSTIFHSIAEPFAEFADKMWKAAMVMYKQKSESLIMPVPPIISAEDKDFEARLSGALMRVVPEEIKVSVIEGSMGQLVSSAMLYMGVLARLQPAGPEEASSLLSFVRSPPIASSARELEGLFRRYRLALRRLVQLNMPEVAPSEQLKALQMMTRTLERKYTAFHMRMNLLRLFPESSTRPTKEGVERYFTTAEQQVLELTADEASKADRRMGAASDAGSTAINTASTSSQQPSKKGICYFYKKPGGCLRKDCPYLHSEEVKGKGKGEGSKRGKGKSKSDKSNVSVAEANASNPRPKPKPNAKPKADSRAQKLLGVEEANHSKVSLLRSVPDARADGYARSPTVARLENAVETHADPKMVLLDSGANEVVRPLCEELSIQDTSRFIPLDVSMASGACEQGYRSIRDGEVAIPMKSDEWIAGLGRVVQAGYDFHWTKQGCRLSSEDGTELPVVIKNGLPYLDWSSFKQVRRRLAKAHRRAPNMQLHRSWGATLNEAQPSILEPGEHMTFEKNPADPDEICENKDALARTEEKAQALLQKGDVKTHELLDVLAGAGLKLRKRRRRAEPQTDLVSIWNFGRYQHGGVHGISSLARARPQLTQLLTSYVRQRCPAHQFTTITVTEDVAFRPHRDKFNQHGSRNVAIGLSHFVGGQVWLHDEGMRSHEDCVWRVVSEHKPSLPGRLLPTSAGAIAEFNPRDLHGTEQFTGHRVMLLAYTPAGIQKDAEEELQQLADMGFVHPQLPSPKASAEASTAHQVKAARTPRPQVRFQEEPEVREFCAKSAASDLEDELDEMGVGLDGLDMLEGPVVSVESGEKSVGSTESEGKRPVIEPGDTFEEMLDKLGLEHDESREAIARANGESLSAPTDSLQESAQELKRKCIDGFYKLGCPDCTAARGHRRLHRRLKGPVSSGTLNVDISGPHGSSVDGFRYFVVAILIMPDGTAVPYARVQHTKSSAETQESLTDIMAQVVSCSDGQVPLLRVHSDGGGEFISDQIIAYFKRMGLWKTKSAPYCKQSSGKVERMVQTLKHHATALLIHAGLPARFWSYAVVHACYLLRAAALSIKSPKDAPVFGALVAIKRPNVDKLPSFVEKTNQGIYLGVDESYIDGANVLIDTPRGLKVVKSRLPVLLNVDRPTWTKRTSPDEALDVWVSEKGEVRWTEPAPDDLMTFEERTDGPQYDDDDRNGNLEMAIKRKLHGKTEDEEGYEASLSRFNHGFLVSAPTCKRVEGKSDETLQINANLDDKYYVYSSDVEADMDEVERITQ